MSQTSYAIVVYPGMRRGLEALHSITQGTLIKEEEILLLNARDTEVLEETELRYYTFKANDVRDCLVLGDGELYNHSDDANVGYILKYLDGRYRMQFYALRDIKQGEQLFIDYNADTRVNVEAYKKQESLI